MTREHVLVGILLTMFLTGCAGPGSVEPASESVVLKDPKTGRFFDCSYATDQRTRAGLQAAGILAESIKQCRSNLLKEGWVVVTPTVATNEALQPNVAADERAYTNPVYRWSISYPSSWTINTGNPRSVTFHGTTPPGVLGIHAIPEAGSKSLDDAVKLVLGLYPSGRYITVSRRSITLPNGYSATEIVHHIGSGTVGKSRKVITVAKGRGFVIDAETYLDSWNAAEPYFNRAIDSFKIQD